MAMRITLPVYLIDKIRILVDSDINLPDDFKGDLMTALTRFTEHNARLDAASIISRGNPEASTVLQQIGLKGEPPPTIDIEVIERTSRWAMGVPGIDVLKAANLGLCKLSTQSSSQADQWWFRSISILPRVPSCWDTSFR